MFHSPIYLYVYMFFRLMKEFLAYRIRPTYPNDLVVVTSHDFWLFWPYKDYLYLLSSQIDSYYNRPLDHYQGSKTLSLKVVDSCIKSGGLTISVFGCGHMISLHVSLEVGRYDNQRSGVLMLFPISRYHVRMRLKVTAVHIMRSLLCWARIA